MAKIHEYKPIIGIRFLHIYNKITNHCPFFCHTVSCHSVDLSESNNIYFFYLGLYLCLNGLQLLINLLDLPHHGRLGLFKGRELLFSLVSLLPQALKLLTGGLVLLVPEGNKSDEFCFTLTANCVYLSLPLVHSVSFEPLTNHGFFFSRSSITSRCLFFS